MGQATVFPDLELARSIGADFTGGDVNWDDDLFARFGTVTGAVAQSFGRVGFVTAVPAFVIDSTKDGAGTTEPILFRLGDPVVVRASLSPDGDWVYTQGAGTSGSPTFATYTAGPHTTLTASVEATDFNFNLARIVQFSTGAIATQRAFRIQGPTYAFAGASIITNAITLDVDPPVAGANATFTNTFAARFNGSCLVNPVLFVGDNTDNLAKVHIRELLSNAAAIEIDEVSANARSLTLGISATNLQIAAAGVNATVAQLRLFSFGAEVQRLTSSGTSHRQARVQFPLGTAGLPAISQNNDVNTGIFWINPDIFGISTGATERIRWDATGDVISTQAISTTGSPTFWTYIGAAHTTLTASVEATDFNFNLARIVQFSTGAIATQRAFRIQGPTYAFAGASIITNAITLDVDPPVAGANATFTDVYAARFNGNVGIGTGVADAGGGDGVIAMLNAATAPTANPTGGGVLYAEAGAGKWRGSGGTITTFGPAEPHCPRCGRDFAHEWENSEYGKLSICNWCLVEALEKLGIDVAIKKQVA